MLKPRQYIPVCHDDTELPLRCGDDRGLLHVLAGSEVSALLEVLDAVEVRSRTVGER
jgi:hypothetical protein